MGASSSSSSPFQRSSAVPTASLRANGRAEEAEADRLADDDAELVRRQLGGVPSSMPNGATQSAVIGGSSPGTAGHRALDADVVRAAGAAADADAAPATREAVRGGAARDREIEVGPLEHARRRRALALAATSPRHDATRSRRTALFITPPLKRMRVGCSIFGAAAPFLPVGATVLERVGLAREERREVLRDRGVLRVRQAELRERRARAGRGRASASTTREEAVDDRARRPRRA